MPGLLTLGETMGLFRAERPGSLAHTDEFRLGIGGAESNVAIGVARLGGSSRWLGRVGADGLGDRIRRELRAEGVDARVIEDGEAATGLMIKSRPVPALAKVDYLRAGSAGSRLRPEDLMPDLFDGIGVLHVTGITPALSASAAETVFAAITAARARGIRVSFDVNHRAALWSAEEAAPVYQEIAALSDVVFAGEDEAALLADARSMPERARALSHGGRDIVIKRGEHGAYAVVGGIEIVVPAVPVAPVDTVGAGDAFVAGFLVEALAGLDASAALQTAVRAGAFACLGLGDWESLPHRRDLDLLDAADPVIR
ncbi:sugar kinase [Microbacterium sediminicola]|uniref:Sugar kinase n=1 Tax=Microbacterium sediminicola TaxID=415210 RepID=A0ABN2IDH9_9MICO